jgi:hypothetical protein
MCHVPREIEIPVSIFTNTALCIECVNYSRIEQTGTSRLSFALQTLLQVKLHGVYARASTYAYSFGLFNQSVSFEKVERMTWEFLQMVSLGEVAVQY